MALFKQSQKGSVSFTHCCAETSSYTSCVRQLQKSQKKKKKKETFCMIISSRVSDNIP